MEGPSESRQAQRERPSQTTTILSVAMEYQSTGPHNEAVAQPGVSPEGAVVGGGVCFPFAQLSVRPAPKYHKIIKILFTNRRPSEAVSERLSNGTG